MAVVLWKESTGTLPLLPSPIFHDRILLYSLFRGKRENLLQQSRVVLWGLAHCLETLCCGPPPPLQDSLGLGDTAGVLALLVPSVLASSRDTCWQPPPPPPPWTRSCFRTRLFPSWPAQRGPHYMFGLVLREWGERSECACAVIVLGAAAPAHCVLMTTSQIDQTEGWGLTLPAVVQDLDSMEGNPFLWNVFFFSS